MMTNPMMQSLYKKPTLEPDWEEARRFHGHLGPWLALGMKIGQEAMTVLSARPHFGTRVHVRCRLAPPVSCLVDGLQWMTGATYGKRNLIAEEAETVHIRVEHVETGTAVVFRLVPGAPEAMGRWMGEIGDEAASYHVFDRPADELYTTEVVPGRSTE
jgi:hypothetical protein